MGKSIESGRSTFTGGCAAPDLMLSILKSELIENVDQALVRFQMESPRGMESNPEAVGANSVLLLDHAGSFLPLFHSKRAYSGTLYLQRLLIIQTIFASCGIGKPL